MLRAAPITSSPSNRIGPRYRRIVAKLGTSLLTAGGERLDLEVMASS